MKTNDIQAALAAFLNNNPGLDEGPLEVTQVKEGKNSDVLHVFIEKKGRNGKVATIIEGFDATTPEQVEELAKELKKSIGTGGSFREAAILIQGNVMEKVKKFLSTKGFKVK